MMFSEKAKERIWTIFAVSPIMQRFAFPGVFGLAVMGPGIWKDIRWLSIVGLILAAPVLWCYFLIIVVCPIVLLFDKPPKQHWEE
jgi:hypothetical protein